MDRKSLSLLSNNFHAYIMPLLDQSDPEDYRVIWEFQKLFHAKRLEIVAAESNGAKDWSGPSKNRGASSRFGRNAGYTS